MSSLIYKLIGKHDLSDAIDKRHCCTADASDDADFTIITERPFAAVAELFTFFKRLLLAESGPQIQPISRLSNVRFAPESGHSANIGERVLSFLNIRRACFYCIF